MKCENCGVNNATTHIKKVINGVVTEQHLCQVCAAQKGLSSFGNNSLASMLASVFGDASGGFLPHSTKKCDACGCTFSDIVNSGLVGCPNCYTEFYDELLPYLKRVHGSTKHTGKIPNKAPLAVKPEKETVEDLRMQLNTLIREEKFEQAAVIRDKIKKLEGKPKEELV